MSLPVLPLSKSRRGPRVFYLWRPRCRMWILPRFVKQFRDALLDVSEVLAGLGIEGQLAIQKTVDLSIKNVHLLIVYWLVTDLISLNMMALFPLMNVLRSLAEVRSRRDVWMLLVFSFFSILSIVPLLWIFFASSFYYGVVWLGVKPYLLSIKALPTKSL